MLVLTVQKHQRLNEIYDGNYYPEFWKSKYAFLSPGYTRGYKVVLDALSKKTHQQYTYGVESCYWGWVRNPFLGFYEPNGTKPLEKRLYGVICDIPDSQLVLSDYDKFCEYVEGTEVSFILEGDLATSDCIQCAFWDLKPENIRLVFDTDYLKFLQGVSVQGLLTRLSLKDESYKFDKRIDSFILPYPQVHRVASL